MAQFQNLPIEIFLSIFKQLSPQDLKSAVLVSKSWQEVGEDPALWTWAVVRVDSRHDFEKFNIQRLQLLRELKVNCTRPASQYYNYCNWKDLGIFQQLMHSGMHELFKLIREIPTVRRISGSSCENCFSSVEPDLLVSVFNSLQELHVGWSGVDLTSKQLELLFTAMAVETNVESLYVCGYCDLSETSPVLLASAISNVKDVTFGGFNVGLQHVEALFSAIIAGDTPLTKLKVSTYSTVRVDPVILGRAVNRLEEVTIYRNSGETISSDQISAIISILVEEETKLKVLRLVEVRAADIEGVDQDLIRRAVERVGEFYTIF
jgi:hypothetical protein